MMFRDARKEEQFGWRKVIAAEDYPRMKDAQICQ